MRVRMLYSVVVAGVEHRAGAVTWLDGHTARQLVQQGLAVPVGPVVRDAVGPRVPVRHGDPVMGD